MTPTVFILQLLLVTVGFACGVVAARRCRDPQVHVSIRRQATALALRALPVVVFCAAARFDHERHDASEIALHAALVVTVFVLCAAVAGLLASWLGCDRSHSAAVSLASGCGSTGMLGVPVTTLLHDSDALPLATVRDQANLAFLALATPAVACWARGTAPCSWSTPRRALIHALGLMPLPALAAGLIVAAVAQPGALRANSELDVVGSLALAVVCATGAVLLGLNADPGVLKRQRRALAVGLGVKLAVAPAVTMAVCQTFGVGAEAVTQMAMPTLLAVTMWSEREQLQPQVAAGLAVLGTLVLPVTLPLVHRLAQHLL
jgi:predicted permease